MEVFHSAAIARDAGNYDGRPGGTWAVLAQAAGFSPWPGQVSRNGLENDGKTGQCYPFQWID